MVAEIEPNNTPAQAQSLNLGFDNGEVTSIRVDGNLTGSISTPSSRSLGTDLRSNDSIGTARNTGISAGEIDAITGISVLTTSEAVEFYRVSSTAGQNLQVLAQGIGGTDTVLEIYDSNGVRVAFNDDISFPSNTNSEISFTVPVSGDYFVAVHSFGVNVNDPFNPNDDSGNLGSAGAVVDIIQTSPDIDYYEVDLNQGDILGAAIDGAAQNVQIFNPDGDLVFGSSDNLSSLYGSESQLVGSAGDNATAGIVASEDGTYLVAVTGGSGSYDLDLNVNRPVLEDQAENSVQHFYLDFDGHTLNGNVFGLSSGNITFDPLADFLDNWGLANTAANRNAVIDSIIAVVERELVTEVAADGTNNDFDIVVLNSRDHEDPSNTELPNVSRLIIGGTIADTGLPTIGLAENLDVGNFDTSDTAFVLLDLLSEVAGDPNSINSIALGSGVSIIDAIGLVVGTIAAHEAGHLLGNFHTENGNSEPNVQDQGGTAIPEAFGGEDGILGTSDDPDIAFGEDAFEADEGLLGTHDTLNNISNSATTGQGNGFAYQIDAEILSYRGDNADDIIGVSINDIESIYYTAFSSEAPFYQLNNVFNDLEQIQINAGNGNNQITIFNSEDNAPDEQDPFLINLNFTVDTVVNTGNGIDIITTSFGNDTINSGSGNDTLDGRGGADILNGGDGIDTINGGSQGDTLNGGAGNDMLFGDQGADTINGGEGDDTIDGGSSSGDVLNGEAGNDIILGGQGNDTIDGGTGEDTVDYSGFGGNITVNLNQNGNPQTAGGGGVDVITNVENIIGGDFADRLTGRGGDSDINGGAGGDRIFGLGGDDMLFGEGANDLIQGGNGNDFIDGGIGQDQLNGGNGNDTILGGDGDQLDRLTGAADDDILDGGGGRDILRGDSFNTSTGMNVTGGNDIFDFNEVNDSVAGGLRDIIRDFVQGEDMIDVSDIDAITGGMDDDFMFIGRDSFSGTAGELRFQDAGRNVVVSADVDGDGTADLQIQLNGNFDLEASDFIL